MESKRQAGLQAAVEEARLVKELEESDGWKKVLEPKLNGVINDQRKIWLKAKSAEVAEIIRLKTAGYEGVFDLIAKVLKEGENAKILLRNSDTKSE